MDSYIFNRSGLSLARLRLNLDRRVPQVPEALLQKRGGKGRGGEVHCAEGGFRQTVSDRTGSPAPKEVKWRGSGGEQHCADENLL